MSTTDTDITHEVRQALEALRAYDTTALGTMGPEGPHVAGVFFAPEATGGGLRLVAAMLQGSHKLHQLRDDPRVAFMCSPGQPARWIQGSGTAEVVDDPARHADLYARLLAHAPGAQPFVERLPVVPVLVTVTRLKVVHDAGQPPLVLDLTPAGVA